jgi:hypothetical protein
MRGRSFLPPSFFEYAWGKEIKKIPSFFEYTLDKELSSFFEYTVGKKKHPSICIGLNLYYYYEGSEGVVYGLFLCIGIRGQTILKRREIDLYIALILLVGCILL